jgi:predicted SnoaL-like aldol condensation-catalyzing enzyme
MLKNLMEKLLGPKTVSEITETVWVNEKKKFNVKKSFATIRMKSGETLLSRVFEGSVHIHNIKETNEEYKWYTTIFGKQALINFFTDISRKDPQAFIQIQEDRLIRCADILDIINIVESDHEIEVEIPTQKQVVKKI